MSRFQFTDKKEKLTDAEIESRMNFDEFLKARPKPAKPLKKTGKIIGGSLAVAAIITTAFLLMPAAKKTYEPFIIPPVSELNPPSEIFSVNNASDTTLLSVKGSQIKVPHGAFVFPGGKPATGNIEIRFREFHDATEIFLSGIPMNYDSASRHTLLESAGMIEILAFQDKKPVELAPGKSISVQMISSKPDDNYNIYYLDTVKRKWEYVSANTRANNTCSAPLYSVNEEQRKKYEALVAGNDSGQPVKPEKANPSATNFRIDYLFSDFPELKAYEGIQFEPLAGEKDFKNKFAETTWEDITLNRTSVAGVYEMRLSTETETHTFKVKAVVAGKSYDEAMAEYAKREQIYQAGLNARKKQFESVQDSMYSLNNYLVDASIRSRLNDRFNALISGDYTHMTKDLLVYRTLNVRKLGIWNSDRPWDIFDEFMRRVNAGIRKTIFPTVFRNKEGRMLTLRSVYIIKKNVATVLPVKSPQTAFPFIPDFVDGVIAITSKNQICYCVGEDMLKTKVVNNVLQFNMQMAGDKIQTADQLRNLVKL